MSDQTTQLSAPNRTQPVNVNPPTPEQQDQQNDNGQINGNNVTKWLFSGNGDQINKAFDGLPTVLEILDKFIAEGNKNKNEFLIKGWIDSLLSRLENDQDAYSPDVIKFIFLVLDQLDLNDPQSQNAITGLVRRLNSLLIDLRLIPDYNLLLESYARFLGRMPFQFFNTIQEVIDQSGNEQVFIRKWVMEVLDNVENNVGDVSEVYFNLITRSWGADPIVIVRLIQHLDEPNFSGIDFSNVLTQERRVELLQAVLERLESDARDEEITNVFVKFLQERFPAEFKEIRGEILEIQEQIKIISIETIPANDRIKNLNNALDYFLNKGELTPLEQKLFRELLDVMLKKLLSSNFADINQIKRNSYGRLILEKLLELRSRSLDSNSIVYKTLDQTVFWKHMSVKLTTTFEMLRDREELTQGLFLFYQIFTSNHDNYKLLGPGLRHAVIENLYESLPSQNATTLLLDLDFTLDTVDGQNLSTLISNNGGNLSEIGNYSDQVEGNLYGEYILFFYNLPEDNVLEFIAEAESIDRLKDLVELIFTMRPDLLQIIEDRQYEKEKAETDKVSRMVLDSAQEIKDSLNPDKDELKKREIKERETKRSGLRKFAHNLPGVGTKWKDGWLKKIDESVMESVDQTAEARQKRIFLKTIRTLEEFLKSSKVNRTYLAVALTDREVKSALDTVLINLCNSPFPEQRARVVAIIRVFALSPTLAAMVPPEATGIVIETWDKKVDSYNTSVESEELELKVLELDAKEPGIVYKLAPIRRFSKRAQAEKSLNELYSEIQKPQNTVMLEVMNVLRESSLCEVYIKDPRFQELLGSLLESITKNKSPEGVGHVDQLNLSPSEEVFLRFVFDIVNTNDHLWNQIPESIKRNTAEAILRNAVLNGRTDYYDVANWFIEENVSPPPVYLQSNPTDYMSAVYIYLIDTDGDFAKKVDELRQSANAPQNRRRFNPFKKKTEDPNAEVIVLFQRFDDYAISSSINSTSTVFRQLRTVGINANLDKQVEADLVKEQGKLETLEQKLSEINLPSNPAEILTATRPEVTQQRDAFIKLIENYVAQNESRALRNSAGNSKRIIEMFNDQDSERFIKIFETILDVYYYEIHLHGNGTQLAKDIRTFIKEIVEQFYFAQDSEMVQKLTKLISIKEQSLVHFAQIKSDNSPQDVTELVEHTDLNGIKAKENTMSIKNYAFELRVSVDGHVHAASIIDLIIRISKCFENKEIAELILDDIENNNVLKKDIEDLLRDLYCLLYKLRKFEPAQKEIERIIKLITENVEKGKLDIKKVVTEAKQKVDNVIKNDTSGKPLKRQAVPNSATAQRLSAVENILQQAA